MSSENNNGINIEKLASQPKKYQIDNEIVESQDIADLIKADEYLSKKKASKKKLRGLKCFTISTQGTGE